MISTPVTTAVVAPSFASPSRVTYANRTINPQDSPRYYENNPSGGKLLYTNPSFANGYVVSPPTTAAYNTGITTTSPFTQTYAQTYAPVASPHVYTQPMTQTIHSPTVYTQPVAQTFQTPTVAYAPQVRFMSGSLTVLAIRRGEPHKNLRAHGT